MSEQWDAPREALSVESLLDTRAGLALADCAWHEGASAMLRAHAAADEGAPFVAPRSPYSQHLLSVHQPARVAPRRMDVEQAIYQALYDGGASFESATVIPAVRRAVLALFAPHPTVGGAS